VAELVGGGMQERGFTYSSQVFSESRCPFLLGIVVIDEGLTSCIFRQTSSEQKKFWTPCTMGSIMHIKNSTLQLGTGGSRL
jgi:hypothetical protein